MSQAPKPRGLGRGLSALLGDEEVAAAVTPSVAPAPQQPAIATPARTLSRTPFTLPIAELRAGPFQPRTTFEGLESLIDSVRQYGLLQPILVRPIPHEANAYEIIAGERRWRAAQKAQLHEVPVVVRSFDNLEALQIALVENLQRTDLSPIDEAAGYRRLMSDFGQTQEEVAQTVGKSRPHVANMLRLLDLPEAVRELVQQDKLSAGQARSLLAFDDPAAMAERTIREKLTVRDLEALARGERPAPVLKKGKAKAPVGAKTNDTRALEKRIEEALGLKASLSMTGKGEQTLLTLEIENYEQLDNVVDRLTRRQ
ncbi:MAG TPA: ParB/RepB/Spo0J family partition protein [Reyranella sp.]|jgi:ParB family chromosome partitioning protein|nr:ParB/RepB/Spo0J family partition protein [Reyranella sp.]